MAEIIIGFCLSLDLSAVGALANGTFVLAHEKLGKNRPENGLMLAHLNDQFFGAIIKGKGMLLDKTPFSVRV